MLLNVTIIILTSGVNLKLITRNYFTYNAPWENSVNTQKEDAYCSCCLESEALLSQTLARNRPPVSVHGLALNLCQDFEENRKRICSTYETKALSEFPGLVCHMEMSCSVALFPLTSEDLVQGIAVSTC